MPFIIVEKKIIPYSWSKYFYLPDDCSAIESSVIKFNVEITVPPERIDEFLAYFVQDKKIIQDNGSYDFHCRGQEAQASEDIKELLKNGEIFSPLRVEKVGIGMSVDRENTKKADVCSINMQGKQKRRQGKNVEIENIFQITPERENVLGRVHLNFHIKYEKNTNLENSIFSLQDTIRYFTHVFSKTKKELLEVNLENFKDLGYRVSKRSTLHLVHYQEKDSFPRNLDFSEVGLESIKHLIPLLSQSTTLHSLHLKDVPIGIEYVGNLALALEKNSGLQTLKLENNSIGMDEIRCLNRFIEKNAALTQLDLSANPLGSEGAKTLFSALKGHSTLKELRLINIQMGDQGAFYLADYLMLMKNKSLTHLSIKNNHITCVGIQFMALALENNHLEKLDLSQNYLGIEGIGTLTRALQKNSSLTFLHLTNSHIDALSAALLAHFLEINTTLKLLNLRSNQIGSVGSHLLALSLGKNTTLECLEFPSNQVGESLSEDVLFILEHNESLITLNVRSNEVKHIQTIIPALEKNTTIQQLDILRKSTYPEKEALESLLSRNKKIASEKIHPSQPKKSDVSTEHYTEITANVSLTDSLEKNTGGECMSQTTLIPEDSREILSPGVSAKNPSSLNTSQKLTFFQPQDTTTVISYTRNNFTEMSANFYPPPFFPGQQAEDSTEQKILSELKRITAQEWKKASVCFYLIAENKDVAESICTYFNNHHVKAVLKNAKRVQIKNIHLETVKKIAVLTFSDKKMAPLH